ncbi:MAG TPA: hypothetical protein VFQ88_16005 [Nevskiaceae bacterium]|nr:hypothetical protein [Nevskiaceae bacterium]
MTQTNTDLDNRLWLRLKHGLITLTLATALVGLIAPVSLLIWQAHVPTVAVLQGPAGTLVSTKAHTNVFGSYTVTHITTSIGNITVHGGFSGPRGTTLTIQRTNMADGLRICAVGTPVDCARVAGAWAGPMRATPAAGHVFDFAQHDLTQSDLLSWGGFGFLGLVMVVLAWVIVFAGTHSCGDDADEEDDDEDDDDCHDAPSVRS